MYLFSKKKYSKAEKLLRLVVTINLDNRIWLIEARAYYELSLLAAIEGHDDQTQHLLEKSLAIRQKHKNNPTVIRCLVGLSEWYLQQDIHKAKAYLVRALENSLQKTIA